jgi:uncharacterized metal-binding protein
VYRCTKCGLQICNEEEAGRHPAHCPGADAESRGDRAAYDGEDRMLAHNAALVEAEGYCRLTRVEETMAFARRCGFERLGLAFCIGLLREARVLDRILTANGFTVESVLCKNGSLDKKIIGIADAEKVEPGTFEPMCNPIGQARALEAAETQLNIVLGLCVGHDSLFFKHSAAPVTVLAAKDRVLGHNPLAAIYLADGYYHNKLWPAGETDESQGAPDEAAPA